MEILNTVDDKGNNIEILVGDFDGKHKIVAGKIVPKTSVELKAEAKAQALADCLKARAAAYATLNQDELRFNDMMNGTTTWKDAILAIKAKHPKPL